MAVVTAEVVKEAIDFETLRVRAIRQFEVSLVDRVSETDSRNRGVLVEAHFHDNATGSAFLNFVTILPGGEQVITDFFNVDQVLRVHELLTPGTHTAARDLMAVRHKQHQADAKMAEPVEKPKLRAISGSSKKPH